MSLRNLPEIVAALASPELTQLDNKTRHTLCSVIFRGRVHPDLKFETVKDLYSRTTTGSLLATQYVQLKRYEDIESISEKLIESPSSSDVMFPEALALLEGIQNALTNPQIYEYTKLITTVNTSIAKYVDDVSARPKLVDTFVEVYLALTEYANDISGKISDIIDRHGTTRLLQSLQSSEWNTVDDPALKSREDNFLILIDALDDFESILQHEKFPPVLAKVLLLPTLGFAGISYVSELNIPFAVNLIPLEYLTPMIQRLDRSETSKLSGFLKSGEFQKVDDMPLQKFELGTHNSLKDMKFETHRDKMLHLITSSQKPQVKSPKAITSTPWNEKASKAFGLFPTFSTQSFFALPSPISSPNPAEEPNFKRVASIPDDRDYHPDPILTRKIRLIVKHYQELEEMDMKRDHMTRFSTLSEQAVALHKRTVRRDDIRVYSGLTIFSQMYVVTFTRTSRKPVFNPVN